MSRNTYRTANKLLGYIRHADRRGKLSLEEAKRLAALDRFHAGGLAWVTALIRYRREKASEERRVPR